MSEFFDMAGHLVRRLHQISVAVFAERMTEAGIALTPVQFAALSAISERPGVDQATLAAVVAYDRATLGGVVDRLHQKGLIARQVGTSDRRARVLSLTEAGQTLLAAARPTVTALQDEILSGLDGQERAALIELLKKATRTGAVAAAAPSRPARPRP